jgi:hypothetical protein
MVESVFFNAIGWALVEQRQLELEALIDGDECDKAWAQQELDLYVLGLELMTIKEIAVEVYRVGRREAQSEKIDEDI